LFDDERPRGFSGIRRDVREPVSVRTDTPQYGKTSMSSASQHLHRLMGKLIEHRNDVGTSFGREWRIRSGFSQRFGDTDRACAAGPAVRFIVDRIVIFWC
jgi:hypothetical protein